MGRFFFRREKAGIAERERQQGMLEAEAMES